MAVLENQASGKPTEVEFIIGGKPVSSRIKTSQSRHALSPYMHTKRSHDHIVGQQLSSIHMENFSSAAPLPLDFQSMRL